MVTVPLSVRAFQVWARAYAAALPTCMAAYVEHDQPEEGASRFAADMADRAVQLAEERGVLVRLDLAAGLTSGGIGLGATAVRAIMELWARAEARRRARRAEERPTEEEPHG